MGCACVLHRILGIELEGVYHEIYLTTRTHRKPQEHPRAIWPSICEQKGFVITCILGQASINLNI